MIEPQNFESENSARPFPWICGSCLEASVYPIEKTVTIPVVLSGTVHELEVQSVQVPTCRDCGSEFYGYSSRIQSKADNIAKQEEIHLLTKASSTNS